ncbi:MAG: SBBP repeat-containing protein, partial [Deltaproteobacteria bacterium]|nr:SBBP repeat-containing protein [Deltaproteobacteria bacterium]
MIPKLNFTRNLWRLALKTYRVCVLVAGLTVLFLCYGSLVHADAVYSFTKILGGTDEDFGQSVAVDSSGNVYITGSFRGTADFDPDAGPDNRTSAGQEDIFLTKIDTSGNGSVVWTRTLGGADQDFGRSVAVDNSGNVYITG